ncbi:MAG: phage holin family protein [Oscillospiraceae bacterium]
MEQIISYIKPELLVLIFVLYLIGIAFKKATLVQDKHIPLLLGAVGIILATLWVLSTSSFENFQSLMLAFFTAIMQGILCAGASVYANQIIKQNKK